MSLSIEEITLSSITERRLVLGNASIARILSVGNSWTRLRIGMRVCLDDSGVSITGTPRIFVGVLNNPSAGVANGPLGISTSHFVGYSKAVATWNRQSSPVGYDTGSATTGGSAIKRVGSTNTEVGLSNFGLRFWSGSPSLRRPLIVDILKGSPNFTIGSISAASGTGWQDMSYSALSQAMEISDGAGMASYVSSMIGNTWTYQTQTVAVDEGTNGILNAICVAWDRTNPLLRISEVLYTTFLT